eukprot:719212-Rhodomonas_salina.1
MRDPRYRLNLYLDTDRALAARLQARYPHTDIADGAICLRTCYAISGTDLAYATTRQCVSKRRKSARLRCYAPLSRYAISVRCPVSSYASATRCPVSLYAFSMRRPVLAYPLLQLLGGVRYRPLSFMVAFDAGSRTVLSSYASAMRCPVLTGVMLYQALPDTSQKGDYMLWR